MAVMQLRIFCGGCAEVLRKFTCELPQNVAKLLKSLAEVGLRRLCGGCAEVAMGICAKSLKSFAEVCGGCAEVGLAEVATYPPLKGGDMCGATSAGSGGLA